MSNTRVIGTPGMAGNALGQLVNWNHGHEEAYSDISWIKDYSFTIAVERMSWIGRKRKSRAPRRLLSYMVWSPAAPTQIQNIISRNPPDLEEEGWDAKQSKSGRYPRTRSLEEEEEEGEAWDMDMINKRLPLRMQARRLKVCF